MANKRMFSMKIIDADAFLDMPLSTQALYFHLSMRADDDGFIGNHKRIMRTIGSSDDELRLLLAKNFIIPFESGVCVIKHWKMHNYIQKDRYHPTSYIEEKAMLDTKENNSYTLKNDVDTKCVQNGDAVLGLGLEQDLELDLEQDREQKKKTPPPILKKEYGEFVKMLETDYLKLEKKISNLNYYLENLNNYIGSTGKKYKSHYHTILSWYNKDIKNNNNSNFKEDTETIIEGRWADSEIKFDENGEVINGK